MSSTERQAKTSEFLTKLADLMQEYDATFDLDEMRDFDCPSFDIDIKDGEPCTTTIQHFTTMSVDHADIRKGI